MIKKQIVTVVAVVAVMGYLYLQPVKGLVKPKEERAAPGKQATESPAASKITSLEDALKKAGSASEKLKLQTELAHEWDNVNQAAPAAFYYMDLAQAKNDFENWFTAGSRFNDAYKFTQDTTMQPTFVSNAILSFKKAIALRPADLESKTGLGVAYVNQTSLGITDPDGGSPMQGIMLLREVVGTEPDNWNANLNLGQFAMKSGQYQKAVERFQHMIALDTKRSKVEPYFYLAESYKQLGMKKEAIDAYVKCKEMMGDPTMGQTIDNYINELKN